MPISSSPSSRVAEAPTPVGPRSTAVTAFSVVVLAVAALAVALLGWATVAPKNAVQWVAVVLGWVFVAALAPRPSRAGDAVQLDPGDFPDTHALVAALATELGVRPPTGLRVDIGFGAHLVGSSSTRRPVLVVGLPLWTCLTDDERIALLGHQLAHLGGRAGAGSALVAHAHGVLERLATLLVPLERGAVTDFEDTRLDVAYSNAIVNGMGRGVLRAVSFPAVLLLRAFERTASRDSRARAHAADLGAARVAGTTAVVRLLLTTMGISGLHTMAGAAVRRRENAFEALAAVRERPSPTAGDVARARTRARAEGPHGRATHPRGDLRLSALEARPTEPDAAALESRRSLVQRADTELAGLRPMLERPLRDELLDSWM